MRRMIALVVVLLLVTVACSTSVQDTLEEGPEENQTAIVQEDDVTEENSPEVVAVTEEDSSDITDVTEEDSPEVVGVAEEDPVEVIVEDDPVVTTTIEDNPCGALINMTEQLEPMAQEHIDCLDWLEDGFDNVYLPAVTMVKYKFYYQGPINQDPLLPEISGDFASIAYTLKIDGSVENATQILNTAIFSVVKNIYTLSDKLGVEEMYIRVHFSENTYIDFFVSMETLRSLPDTATRYDVLNSLTFALFFDGEEQRAEESESTTEPTDVP